MCFFSVFKFYISFYNQKDVILIKFKKLPIMKCNNSPFYSCVMLVIILKMIILFATACQRSGVDVANYVLKFVFFPHLLFHKLCDLNILAFFLSPCWWFLSFYLGFEIWNICPKDSWYLLKNQISNVLIHFIIVLVGAHDSSPCSNIEKN